MDDKHLEKTVKNLDEDRTYENIIVSGIFSIMMVMMMMRVLQSQVGAQMVASAYPYPAVAENAGLVWIQMTPAGEPNQVRIISENSTGAFEEVLLGLTT